MNKPIEYHLTFYPASQEPTLDMKNQVALLYNYCDGYHLAENIYFNHDGSFDAFYDFLYLTKFTKDLYSYWAIIPKELLL